LEVVYTYSLTYRHTLYRVSHGNLAIFKLNKKTRQVTVTRPNNMQMH